MKRLRQRIIIGIIGIIGLFSVTNIIGQVTKSNPSSGSVDGGTVDRFISFSAGDFSGTTNVTDVNLRITWSGLGMGPIAFTEEMALRLISPSGTTVDLVQDAQGVITGDNTQVVTYPGIDTFSATTTFDDEAGVPTNNTPETGSFQPQNSLSAFDGESAIGTWTIRVGDGSTAGGFLTLNWTQIDLILNTPVPAPVISVSGTGTTDFGVVNIGESATLTYTINNTGSVPLMIQNITSDVTEFMVVSSLTTIAAGSAGTFDVVFTPVAAGADLATITIESDASNGDVEFDVQGTGSNNEFFVSTTGSDTNDGLSFATAFATVQKALSESVTNTKIYVAAGTYKPTQTVDAFTGSFTSGNVRDATFLIPSTVQLYGGFSGNETQITQGILDNRDFAVNETVLSGDIDNDGILNSGNSYHVVLTVGVDASTLIDGFNITGGYANVVTPSTLDAQGGGALNINWFEGAGGSQVSSNPSFRNCVFKVNFAIQGGAYWANSEFTGMDVSFENCAFIQNESTIAFGGAIHQRSFSTSTSLEFTNCIFSRNESDRGAAVYLTATSPGSIISTIFTNCTFTENITDVGGTIFSNSPNNAVVSNTIRNCIFWDNQGTTNMSGTSSPSFADINGASTDIAHSLVQESSAGDLSVNATVGAGMIYASNPIFIDPSNENFAIDLCSPAVDAGASSSVNVSTDYLGNPRVLFNDVDMGALESNSLVGISRISSTGNEDFGSIQVGSSVTRTFTVESIACVGTLNITNITSSNANFTVSPTSLSIAAGGTATFVVTYTPTTPGLTEQATITILSDADNGTSTFSVSGTVAGQNALFVSTTGNDTNNGLTFATAFATLQKALEESTTDTKIYVATGTYKPTQTVDARSGSLTTGNSRDATFLIPSTVQVYGGFVGNETQITQAVLDNRDFVANETVLSGDIDNNGTLDNGNVFHILLTVQAASSTLIDGFTVSDGSADVQTDIDGAGAGIFNSEGFSGGTMAASNPIVKNCLFTNNRSGLGGAVYLANGNISTDMTFENCTFDSNFITPVPNSFQQGGAIFIGGGTGTADLTVRLYNCTFLNNQSNSNGGAISIGNFSTTGAINLIATNCAFSGNHTTGSGGVIYSDNDNMVNLDLTNCLFFN
ncbi:MAG: choice-of-anchor D domain-containing protein, partial [Bacteroidota bacterium]